MFTGIIEHRGEIIERRHVPEGVTFAVGAAGMANMLEPGDSVSINGACHTVESSREQRFEVTSVGQTLRLTTMGALQTGDVVNLEKAATADTALGGHMVQGHVDGVGRIVSFTRTGEDRMLTIEIPREIHDVVVAQGSIAIDGVSLTVAERHEEPRVTIAIVPWTLENTTIGEYREGDAVNVEADVIGKYVKQYVDRWQPAASSEENR